MKYFKKKNHRLHSFKLWCCIHEETIIAFIISSILFLILTVGLCVYIGELL